MKHDDKKSGLETITDVVKYHSTHKNGRNDLPRMDNNKSLCNNVNMNYSNRGINLFS